MREALDLRRGPIDMVGGGSERATGRGSPGSRHVRPHPPCCVPVAIGRARARRAPRGRPSSRCRHSPWAGRLAAAAPVATAPTRRRSAVFVDFLSEPGHRCPRTSPAPLRATTKPSSRAVKILPLRAGPEDSRPIGFGRHRLRDRRAAGADVGPTGAPVVLAERPGERVDAKRRQAKPQQAPTLRASRCRGRRSLLLPSEISRATLRTAIPCDPRWTSVRCGTRTALRRSPARRSRRVPSSSAAGRPVTREPLFGSHARGHANLLGRATTATSALHGSPEADERRGKQRHPAPRSRTGAMTGRSGTRSPRPRSAGGAPVACGK